MASFPGILHGRARRLRVRLQLRSLQLFRAADGAAVSAFEEPECSKRRCDSADARQRVLRSRKHHDEYVCARSEFQGRLRTNLVRVSSARSSRIARDAGNLYRYQGYSPASGLRAQYISQRCNESLSRLPIELHVLYVGRQFRAGVWRYSVTAQTAQRLYGVAALYLFEVN